MGYSNVPIAANGDWIDPAYINTYLGDNLRALSVYSATGDLGYWDNVAKALVRLAKGANGTILGVNVSGNLAYTTPAALMQIMPLVAGQTAESLIVVSGASNLKVLAKGPNGTFLGVNPSGLLEWRNVGLKTASLVNATGHTYNSSSWRDMPNSSGSIVLDVTSKVQVTAVVVNYTTNTSGFRKFQIRVNGVDVGIIAAETYQSGETVTTTIVGEATGVPAGTRTILIREQAEAGDYVVTALGWNAIATPE